MKKKISDSRSAENISDKRLRIELQPAETNGGEGVKRFLNVHLHCIVSNLHRISKNSTTLPPWINFCGCPWIRSNSWAIMRGAVWLRL